MSVTYQKNNSKHCSAVYVGETRMKTGKMMSERQRAGGKRNQKSYNYKHCFEMEEHRFDFIAGKIVATEELESSKIYMEGVHLKITYNAIYRAENIPVCSFRILGIGKRS